MILILFVILIIIINHDLKSAALYQTRLPHILLHPNLSLLPVDVINEITSDSR